MAGQVFFTEETMKFLRGLKKNNDREWFEARRDVYERALKAPMLAFVEAINAKLVEFAPEHVRPANKITMRIYRDTRFSKNKAPYKTQLPAWWARRGMEKTSGGGYYMHINPQEVLVAAGVYMPEREQLLKIRTWMAENHAAYRKLLKTAMKGHGLSLSGDDALTRMPKGFAAEHPADELLRAKNWGVSVRLPAELALQPTLLSEVVKRMKAATPVVEALNGAILAGVDEREGRPRKALF
ncbi:TIGR02453 family protein [Granulicella sp. 5B5]|uniref:DUF2461 domain-containing protein n=1 Tax=Granulicella sp. 5B5 TaxID=1617967 RepID=UPI0015F750BF|nr:DUF2461 domain-containing protein [Granulicella sp. 5B5]QMV18777.1 TIGR02453 family protein [Granulicella sp. 5B5]